MITLNDLTSAQVDMCERIWRCKTMEAFESLLAELKLEDRRMALTLMQMIVQEGAEEELAAMHIYPDADAVIARAKRG